MCNKVSPSITLIHLLISLSLSFFSLYAPSPSRRSTSSSPYAAVVYRAYRSKPGLVCGCGQCWLVWWRPLERQCVAGAFPIRCRNWQRVHLLFSQLWDHPTGQNHTGGSAWAKCNIQQSKANNSNRVNRNMSLTLLDKTSVLYQFLLCKEEAKSNWQQKMKQIPWRICWPLCLLCCFVLDMQCFSTLCI